MKARLVLVSAVLAVVSPGTDAAATSTKQGVEQPSIAPIAGTDTVQGCFSSKGNLKLNGTDNFNSQGSCNEACRGMGLYVGATQAHDCYCGNKYPPQDTHVADSKCAEPCPGFGTQACGGLDTWTVYNTGVMVEVAFEANGSGDGSSSTAAGDGSTATTAAPSVVTVSGTVVVTSTPSETGSSKKSGGSTTGIAVGAALGACAAAAGVGAVFFFIRRKRNREIEEEHQRQAAVSSFINGDKPGSSGGLSMSDARLDPVMANRRMSDGSIADNEDYSRRILRVTNA